MPKQGQKRELPQKSTILTAVAAAGGLSGAGKTEKVAVLWGEPDQKLEQIECDIARILAGKDPAVALRDGDVVYVDQRVW